MFRGWRFPTLIIALITLVIGGIVYAQLETGDRGILPLDTSDTVEITGIHVDVGGTDAETARYTGWRIAQREGFKMLWAKVHNAPVGQAPVLPDSTLDQIVSSINVEREQIGPARYIADLGIMFDRAKAATFLGEEGAQVQHSEPMLLIPIMVSGGTETSVELRNAWQRAWAEFHTAASPIQYVRVSGMGPDPMLINAAQTRRPGRGWWRALLDMYSASDVLVAEVQLQRLYPGGPARARFIARHGPDDEILGGFTLTAASSDKIPAMMAEGAQRMDQIFATALAEGRLTRDPSLNLPPPPVVEAPVEAPPPPKPATNVGNSYQVQISGNNVTVYNFAMAHLRTLAGIESAVPQQINPGGTSYVLVTYHGDIAQLAAALTGRGWVVDYSGTVVRMRSAGDKPPPLPPPPPPAPPPAAAAPQPVSNQAAPRPQ